MTARRDDGLVAAGLPLLLWFTTVIAIVLVDLGGYLVAAARAQLLADAAALAAVSVKLPDQPALDATMPARRRGPVEEARRVTDAGAGVLERCDCVERLDLVTVEVSVAVPGLVLPRLGARRVRAWAQATLVPP